MLLTGICFLLFAEFPQTIVPKKFRNHWQIAQQHVHFMVLDTYYTCGKFIMYWNQSLFWASEKRCATPCHCKKRGRATPWTYKKGVATPWTCNQSLIKPSAFYSIRRSTFTQTPKRSKEIDPPLSVKYLLKRKQTNELVCIINANASNQHDDWRI